MLEYSFFSFSFLVLFAAPQGTFFKVVGASSFAMIAMALIGMIGYFTYQYFKRRSLGISPMHILSQTVTYGFEGGANSNAAVVTIPEEEEEIDKSGTEFTFKDEGQLGKQ